MSASPSSDVIYRIKRGLCGYVSYLAACEMNQAFSEYVLYEPILRILTARNYTVHCEYECPGIAQPVHGDKKRLDFYAIRMDEKIALEVKWAKVKKPDVARDAEKLCALLGAMPDALALLCVFGKKSLLADLVLPAAQFNEWGKAVYADFGKTRYGCRVYRVVDPTSQAHER